MRKQLNETKVLIIEDDQEKRQELVEILRDKGIHLKNVFSAGYAETGIDLLNNEQPDVVLLDLTIPYNEESRSLKIDNSNKVIKEVERLNALRNLQKDSTGIIIISASIDDRGVINNYKHIPEIVDFFDKDDIALKKNKFKDELLNAIQKVTEREFKHECKIEFTDLRSLKVAKLKSIHTGLHKRVTEDLLGEFERLNNKNVNISRVAEYVIGIAGIIVEDILNLVENEQYRLTEIDQSDNFNTVRSRLTKLTGRRHIGFENYQNNFEINNDPIFSRKAADYAIYAYKLRSEALHSKEGDKYNNKIFKDVDYTAEDAALSINLIMPLVSEYIGIRLDKKK